MKTSHLIRASALFSIALVWALTVGQSLAADDQKPEQPKPAATAQLEKVRTLGIVIFPGFELLDAYGPLEMWGNLKGKVKVVTVAREKGEITSSQGPKTVAEFGFKDCPPLDLILIPGGFGALDVLKDTETLDWLRERSAKAEITMSVCNGASVLAAASLLDGRPATTNKAFWSRATTPWPNVKWVKRARWVDDGRIVTSSGVSAGMDMTLHVVERLFGKKTADNLANGSEYEWHRDPSWDPYAELHGLVQGPK
ncbi:MAG: DJ-1/PfpI family protein [Verrucomicrobia bacterium]|nr:DJ-1/PfpI family protein [Verrucomicrobiota bacterium]